MTARLSSRVDSFYPWGKARGHRPRLQFASRLRFVLSHIGCGVQPIRLFKVSCEHVAAGFMPALEVSPEEFFDDI